MTVELGAGLAHWVWEADEDHYDDTFYIVVERIVNDYDGLMLSIRGEGFEDPKERQVRITRTDCLRLAQQFLQAGMSHKAKWL